MSTCRYSVPLIWALAAGLVAAPLTARAQQPVPPVNYDLLAPKLVTQNAGIKHGEIVLITGDLRDVDLIESIAVQVRKQGAHPLISLGSERLERRMWDEVPASLDTQSPDLSLKLTGIINAVISISNDETPGLLSHVPPERLAARAKASEPVQRLFRQRNIRLVELGNQMYPTADRAQRYGIPREELARIFWSGVNTDYAALERTGNTVKAVLTSGRELRITNPNGTDLRMRIEGRPVYVSDGVISEEDQRMGSPATSVWLPAGEVYFAPVPGTAQGRLVVDRHFVEGKPVEGLTLTFQNGKLTAMTARSGMERMKAIYDAAGPGKEEFAFVDIGINPEVRIPAGSNMVAWVPAGMVTVGTGNNTWAGGANEVSYGNAFHLPGSTVRVDGKVLVDRGVLRP